MWTTKKSVTLSLILCYVLGGLVIISIAILPSFEFWIVENFTAYKNAKDLVLPTVTAFYICILPVLAALFCLIRLLKNLKKSLVFIEQNIFFLRIISWCCAIVSVACLVFCIITLVMSFYTACVAFLIISVAAIFVFLILRVIKNVMSAAVDLKNENDMTI